MRLLAHLDGVLRLLASLVAQHRILLKANSDAVDSNREQRLARSNTLWHNDSTVAIAARLHNDALHRHLARSRSNTRSHINSGSAGGIHHEHTLIQRVPLASLEATALGEYHIDARQAVRKAQLHSLLARSDILGLSPQKVRLRIAVNTICARLVLRHLEGILRNAANRGVGIVGVEVDVRLGILVVDIAARGPSVVGLVVGVASIVDLVALVDKRARSAVVIGVVNTKETNLVAVAEATIVDTRGVGLRNTATDIDSNGTVGLRLRHHDLNILRTARRKRRKSNTPKK